MKIGIETDDYTGIVTFEIDDDDEDIRSDNLLQLLLTAKSCSKDSVDMIIKVKEVKNKNKTNE